MMSFLWSILNEFSNRLGLFLMLSLVSSQVYCLSTEKDSTVTKNVTAMEATEVRTFPQLDYALQQDFFIASQHSELTQEYLNNYVGVNIDVETLKGKAKDAIDKVKALKNFVSELKADGLFELPIGLQKMVNSTTITIAISQVKFEAEYAELTAFAKIEIPQEPRELYFGLEGIKLSYKGGIVGEAKLVLLGDLPIRINGGASALILKGSNDLKTSSSTGSKTYLAFDCNGYKELSISADVEFPRSLLIPVDEKGKRIDNPEKRVKGSFTTIASDWSDILIELSLPSFEIPQLNDVIFSVNTAVLDLSDLRNSPTIEYPRNYETNYMVPSSPTLWRGLYAKTVSITLPSQFKDKSDANKRISFTGFNMLVDNNGLSGLFNGKNILPISKGTASGWKFSVDEIGISLEANNLTGASFKGLIGLPIAEKDTFAYEAIMMPDKYVLSVKTVNKFSFTVWNAQVDIDPNSYVQLEVSDGKFKPEAMLHGRMGVKLSRDESGKSMGEFKGIEFKSLHIMTETPYLEVEYFGYKGEIKFGNFPMSLEDIGVTAQNGKAKLGFTIKLNLMEAQFGGSARVEVKGVLKKEDDGDQRWKYDGINVSAISIHATISGCLKIAGTIVLMDDDPVYGNGIAGRLDATFIPIKVDITARAIFGAKDFRYWLVDGSISYGDGIPIVGPLRIHGFGGGAFYRMKRTIDGTGLAAIGLDYVPDEKTYFGIKAAVLFNVFTRSVVDGEASFEIGFTKSMGISYIGFYGDARFVGKIPGIEKIETFVTEQKANYEKYEAAFVKNNPLLAKQLERLKTDEPSKAAEALFGDVKKMGESGMISAHVGIMMDFVNKTFHSTFDVYVNVAGGLLKGVGKNNRAGWSVLHIGPDECYLYMGTPVDPVGIQFGIGSFSMKTLGYFMAGSKVLDSPPVPQAVADILGIEIQKLDYMRDLNALEDGAGIAFGTSFSIETGDIHMSILYANFRAGAGFDIMLRDYGDAHCEGSDEPIGISGWYASGQAYAYLQGEVGVSVKLFGFKKKFSILKGSSAVLLQARLPNPSLFKGYMAIKVDVLGGLVSGKFRLKIEFGNDCHIVNDSGSPLVLNVISDLKPMDQSKNVDVFAAPQVAFNMRMEQPFYVEDDKGTKTYRIKMEEFSVTDNGINIPGKLVWNNNRDVATYYSSEVLPPEKTLKALVRVSFEIQQGETWQVVYDQGKKAEEIKEVSFTTGTAPDNIPLSNIEYAYPVVSQRNYYRDESTEGYIQLKRGQSYLFSSDWKYEIRIATPERPSDNQSVQYNTAEKRIDFSLPKLNLSSTYFIGLIATPSGTSTTETPAVIEQSIKTDDGDLTVKSNQAGDVLQIGLGKSLVDYSFHTSKHISLAEKVNELRIREPFVGKISSDVINLQPLVSSYEPFDIQELTGTVYTNASSLVTAQAIPDDPYYQEDIYPRIYRDYPVANEITLNRDTTEFGFYPSRAMPIASFYLMEAEKEGPNAITSSRLPYIYDLPRIYHSDFIDLQAKIVNKFLGTPQQSKYAYIILESYPFMRYGAYKVNFQYVFPNGKKGSSATFSYFNPIK